MIYFLKVKLCLTFILLFTLNAQADYVGTSGFALLNAKFPCDDFIEIHKSAKRPFASTLWGTFGTNAACLRRFAEVFKDRPHAIQIHLLNNTCIRNKACREGEPFPRWSVSQLNRKIEALDPLAIQRIVNRVQRIEKLVSGFRGPNTEIILGLGLEDNYTTKAYKNLLQVVAPNWPYKLSRNPLGNHNYVGQADYLERHGSGAHCGGKAQIVNQDGTYFNESASRKWIDKNYNCKYLALWVAESQGRIVSNGKIKSKVTPPRSRTFRYPNKNQQKRLLKYAS